MMRTRGWIVPVTLALGVLAGCGGGDRGAGSAAKAVPATAAPAPATVVASGPSREVTLEVGGMVCAACSIKVTRSLAAVPGVRRVELSLAGQSASVTCDAALADTALTAAVRRAGPEYLGLVVR